MTDKQLKEMFDIIILILSNMSEEKETFLEHYKYELARRIQSRCIHSMEAENLFFAMLKQIFRHVKTNISHLEDIEEILKDVQEAIERKGLVEHYQGSKFEFDPWVLSSKIWGESKGNYTTVSSV
eukprot:CAMPEP_0117433564 /NCGR_PEP_ID=MMETSP0758-20121206/12914_1 /TAXON_ID=63605 /ORGANISM="Percolomonas cosmopolitus, Strain AE-1 (ATCC 50343)" /LENGTH=124 /DNA_ID=CAMNT_0005224331 /DNA_START=294 /DNA_END=665 /DNA_ORIENTATION=+